MKLREPTRYRDQAPQMGRDCSSILHLAGEKKENRNQHQNGTEETHQEESEDCRSLLIFTPNADHEDHGDEHRLISQIKDNQVLAQKGGIQSKQQEKSEGCEKLGTFPVPHAFGTERDHSCQGVHHDEPRGHGIKPKRKLRSDLGKPL